MFGNPSPGARLQPLRTTQFAGSARYTRVMLSSGIVTGSERMLWKENCVAVTRKPSAALPNTVASDSSSTSRSVAPPPYFWMALETFFAGMDGAMYVWSCTNRCSTHSCERVCKVRLIFEFG